MKSRIVILLFAAFCFLITIKRADQWADRLYEWDISGYHLHLPAAIIYGDIEKLTFYSYIDDVYKPTGDLRNYCLYDTENGNRVNRYSIGVAVFDLPFFLIAHFINVSFLDFPADGYSLPYQWATIISNIFWVAFGLFLLYFFLRRHFSDMVVAMTLAAIGFGTNLFTYVVFRPGMSHTYSFFCFSLLLLLTDSFYRDRRKINLYMIGAVLGLIGLIRIPNLVVVIIPLLWGVYNKQTFIDRYEFLKARFPGVMASALCFIGVMMIQLGYWKYVAGTWIYDGYQNEGFLWSEPAIYSGLFSFHKGWFVYTPMAVFMVLGIYTMKYKFRQYIPAISIFFILNLYIVFSWGNWWYGGGFSARALIESLAILALPLATFIQYMRAKMNTVWKSAFYVIISFLVFLNVFQSYQFSKGIFDHELNSREYYFKAFLKVNVTDDDRKYMLKDSVVTEIHRERTEQFKK
ncbi:MAG TPA: hypothetical protein VIN07_10325 [Flavipsychrobacter sp.]